MNFNGDGRIINGPEDRETAERVCVCVCVLWCVCVCFVFGVVLLG